MKCRCPVAQYCKTHQREMSPALHKLCQSGDGYFEAFQADLQRSEDGSSSGCGCEKRRRWLNKKTGSLKLGDKVEAVTKATGIKAAVERFGRKS